MRASWIVTCALAVIGAFFIVLQVLWLLHIEVEWLPYVAHVVGAAFAGAAMARSTPPRSLREPLAGGVLAIAALAAITFVLPRAFVLTAARIEERWLVLPVVVAASGLACTGGAWLGRFEGAPARGWIATVAAMTSACSIQLGGRLGYVLGVPITTSAVTIEMGVLALLAGIATQAVVTVDAIAACAIGAAAFVALGIVAQMAKHVPLEASTILLVVPIVGAALGARLMHRATTAAA